MKFKNYIETESGIKDTSTSPGTAGQVLSSTVTGTSWIDQGEIIAAASKLVVIACKNVSGGTILKGTPVYQSGTVGATDVIEIEPADATISTGYLPAIGILQTTLNNNISGNVVITGEFLNYDTASIPTNNPGGVPITGDTVYLAPGGGLTCIKPTGEGNAIQNLGLIGKVSGGSAGSITVSSIMRANDVPNLPTGKIWVGDGNTIVSDTVYLDETNNRMGIGTASPLGAIQIGDGTAIQPSTNEILVLSNVATTGGNSNLYLVTGPSGTSTIGMGASVTAAQNTAGKIIYSDAVDTFSFNTDFSTKMIINREGEVGIGTTNPVTKLEINGPNHDANFTSGCLMIKQASTGDRMFIDGNDIDTADGTLFLNDYSLNAVRLGGDLQVPNGDIGIGFTTAPTQRLHVDGNVRVTGDYYDSNNSAGTTGQVLSSTAAGTDWVLVSDLPIDTRYVAVAGDTMTGTLDINRSGSGQIRVNNQAIFGTHYTSTDVWIYGANAGSSIFLGGGIGNFQNDVKIQNGDLIVSNGNAGIGTTSPQAKLDVNGGVRIANDTAAASATNVGTLRYRTSGNNSYVDMVMQTGAATYAWVNIVQNTW